MPNFRPLAETKFINDANLVSYWKLDGNSNDYKGGNNGTDANVSYAAGQFNQAAGFNGTSSGVSINSFPSLSAPYTVSCWYKPNGDNTTSLVPDKGIISARIDASHEWIYSLQVSNTSIDLIIGNGSAWYNTTSAPYTFTTGIWYYITTVCGVNNSKLYINGVEIQNLNYTGTPLFTKGIQTIALGYVPHYKDTCVNASIDDVAIFSRALSASEVNELYPGMTLTYGEYLGAGSGTTKLLLHLNGSSADSSGNNNNGTDTAITYVDGKFGKCASLNGTNSGIYIGDNLTFGNDPHTIVTWFKLGNNTQNREIVQLNKASGNLSTRIYYNNGNLLASVIKQGIADQGAGTALTDTNGWHLGIATFDGSVGKIYLDGTYKNQFNYSGTGSYTTSNKGSVGFSYDNTTPQRWFNGLIDETLVENYAWTPQQVAKYYTMTKGRFGII